MMEQPIIDVAVGLIFFYVVLSLVCSSIQEVIASFFGLRSKNLQKGIKNLIGDEYARAIYQHPLVKGLRKPGKRPSYIKPDIFSSALIEVVIKDKANKRPSEMTTAELRETIQKIDSSNPARDLLLSLLDRGENKLDDLRQHLSDWFDQGMDRVSGWYKRQVKYFLLGIATVVTLAVNADSIHIAEQLWLDDELRAILVAEAEQAVQDDDLEQIDPQRLLDTFPIGYSADFQGFGIQTIVGWLLTIAAISLGAPFWFDLLSKVSHLRGSGTKEADKAKET